MEKVTIINLGGRAYQLEEGGYLALEAYLKSAKHKLASDQGQEEIISDLEHAFAEKCDKVLSPHKTVVTTSEIEHIIDEMGPVETEGAAAGEETAKKDTASAPKRLYLIRERAMISGVCTGLGAFFDVDVTLVRVTFAVLTIMTGGIWIAAYVALAVLIPYADTGEAQAAAHGEAFRAEDIVRRAKERFEESYKRFTGTDWAHWDKAEYKKWKHEMKHQAKQWKYQAHQWKYAQHGSYRHPNPLLGMLIGALSLMWIFSLLSLISHHTIFGWPLPAGVPVWAAMFALFIVFQAVVGPMRAARAGTNWHSHTVYSGWEGIVDGMTVLFLFIALGWAYLHIPQVSEFVRHPVEQGSAAWEWVKGML